MCVIPKLSNCEDVLRPFTFVLPDLVCLLWRCVCLTGLRCVTPGDGNGLLFTPQQPQDVSKVSAQWVGIDTIDMFRLGAFDRSIEAPCMIFILIVVWTTVQKLSDHGRLWFPPVLVCDALADVLFYTFKGFKALRACAYPPKVIRISHGAMTEGARTAKTVACARL